jgi:uncharacterized protein (TIGR02145 family)
VNPATTTNYTLYVQSVDGCTASVANATQVTVNGNPTITLTSANNSQTLNDGDAINPIIYATTNVSGATVTGLPPGVSGSWDNDVYTISGTPTVSGTFNYTVTTTNNNGCADAAASGTIILKQSGITYSGCTAPTLTLLSVGFTSTKTYSANGGLTISSPVTVTYCNNRSCSSFDGGVAGAYKADCATNSINATYGNWISWCMVMQYAKQLCPSPWRVPTHEEHCLIVNNSKTNCANKDNFVGTHDFVICGSCGAGVANTDDGWYWSSTAIDSNQAYTLKMYHDKRSITSQNTGKSSGGVLRCVK